MSKVIAVINQKGGVGKTTSAIQLGVGLKQRGYKVLFIDMDAQCNLTFALAGSSEGKTVLDVLTKQCSAADAIQFLDEGYLIPASQNLSSIGQYLTYKGREYTFREAIEPIRNKFDYIIIDSPPALGLLTVSILIASDSFLVPAAADIFSLQGISQLYSTYMAVKKYCNPDLKIDGILLTRHTDKLMHSSELRKQTAKMAAEMGTKVFKTSIRESVIVREAETAQQSLYKYARLSRITKDYEDFIDEYLKG